MKTGYAVALAILAFAAGALLVGAAAQGGDMMGGWSASDMWAACQGMMEASQSSA